MRLDILGANGTYPEPGGACSGYLLSADGFNLWIDAGTGTLARLQQLVPLSDIDAVFLSHMHADHFVDIYPLFYALWVDPTGRCNVPAIAPKGSSKFLEFALGGGRDSAEQFHKTFEWREQVAGETFEIGPFRMELFDSYHSAVNLTMRVEHEGKVFCYSGDTGPNEHLAVAARDADLFLCEASWQREQRALADPIHMRSSEAGETAAAAGADRLMLTHIMPSLDTERSRLEASEAFRKDAEIAHNAATVEI